VFWQLILQRASLIELSGEILLKWDCFFERSTVTFSIMSGLLGYTIVFKFTGTYQVQASTESYEIRMAEIQGKVLFLKKSSITFLSLKEKCCSQSGYQITTTYMTVGGFAKTGIKNSQT
jgi:hypothetical protein